ncbi:MAG: carboxypeptidase regulatory-like domain-containing protein [Candidatus Aminicenantes bacterium]|nr:carboxypeptidase regulatory-like domain-containing protein [Candidatus Aminicenantes bacterium]
MLFRRFVFFILAAFLLSVFGFSQITQTGNLNGTIFDKDKQPLPGVSVSIKSPALIQAQVEMITTEYGRFRFPALPPGTYTMTAKLKGFKTYIREGIRMTVGVTATVDVVLEQSTVEENVTVVAATPTVDLQKTTLVASLTREFLQSVPAARNLGAYFGMVAGVTSGLVHGSSERDNTFNIDGVNVTDPVTGTQAGSFSMDIMEELSVQTAGLPAEYGSVRGGVINVVSRSGGNKLSGAVSAYYRTDKIGGLKLQGDNTQGTVFAGQKSGFDYEVEPGFQLGGPIIKDKIWFFLNASYYKAQEYSPGYPYDKQPTNTPLDFTRYYPYAKLTFQLSKKDRVVLSYNYSNYIRHHRDAGISQTVDTTWNQETPIHTINGQWVHFFSSDFFMNVKAAFMGYQLLLSAKHPLPNIYDSILSRNYQSYGYDDLYTRDRLQFLTDATYFVDNWIGRHEFKGGMEAEFSWDIRDRIHYRDPNTGLGPFFYIKSGVPDYVVYYQDLTRKDQKLVLSGFVQDTWNPIERLAINVGFRYDYQQGIIPVQGEKREPVTYLGVIYDPRVMKAFSPMKWHTISPRLGVTYDLFGNGKTVVKASFGRYYIANIMQYFVTVNPNSFISWRYRLNPDMTPKGSMYNFSATAAAKMDPDLKVPYLDEFTIGFERELLKNLKLGVRYIRKWDRNLIEGVNLNSLDYEALKSGGYGQIFDVWTNYTPVSVVDPYSGQTVQFWYQKDSTLPVKTYYTNPAGADRNYNGVEITLDKRFSDKWQATFSYVYSHSRGLIGTDFDDSATLSGYFDNPNAHINALGDFSGERKHQFKISGLWQGPWGINISGYFRYLDGSRWTRMIRAYDLGLNPPQGNVTIYAERRGTEKFPWYSMLDLRLEKAFNLPGKFGKIAVFADVFNVFNVNTTTGISSISSRTTPLIVNNQPVAYGGTTAIVDPRVARLGFRFEF